MSSKCHLRKIEAKGVSSERDRHTPVSDRESQKWREKQSRKEAVIIPEVFFYFRVIIIEFGCVNFVINKIDGRSTALSKHQQGKYLNIFDY